MYVCMYVCIQTHTTHILARRRPLTLSPASSSAAAASSSGASFPNCERARFALSCICCSFVACICCSSVAAALSWYLRCSASSRQLLVSRMQLLIGERTAGDSSCSCVAAVLQLLIGERTAAGDSSCSSADSSCSSVAALLQLLIGEHTAASDSSSRLLLAV